MTVYYLAGPITDVPNARENFERGAALLSEDGAHAVLNPFDIFTERPPVNPTPQEKRAYWQRAMRACIAVLLQAEVIAMLPGWENSEGASWEFRIATEVFGMPVLYLQPDDERHPLADEEMA